MSATLRTFIAVETGEAVRQRAAELIAACAATGAKVSWVKPHNLHLTLKFLGDVRTELIPPVCEAVRQAAAAIESFDLEIRGAGAFPSPGKPRTLWLGTASGSQPLADLHSRLEDGLKRLGFSREQRRFAAHLTIGRVRDGGLAIRELGGLIKQHADFNAGQFTVGEVIVFSSQLMPEGPIYTAMSRARLA